MYTTEAQIEDFIEEYKRSRVISETSVRAVLKRALQYESIFDKPFYKFDKDEIIKMYTEANTRAIRSLLNWNLILRHAASWILDSIQSPYADIVKDDLYQCIDTTLIEELIVSREQLNTLQNDLANETDKAILELLFLGVSGGKWSRELTYLEPEQVSYTDLCIYFRSGKVVNITEEQYYLIQKAFQEDQLISYTANQKVVSVIGSGIFKVRPNTRNDSTNSKDDDDARRRFQWLQRRMDLMSKYFDLKLTTKIVNASGLWHYSHVEMKRMGITDFKEFLLTSKGRDLAFKYGFKTDNYVGILVEKYKNYL